MLRNGFYSAYEFVEYVSMNFESIRQGYVSYVINTRDINSTSSSSDGQEIRQCAVENNVTVFTALDTVKVLLDVLEETTLGISTIDA